MLDLFREHGPAYAAKHALSQEQRRFLSDVQRCRTAALGGHLYACDHCDYERSVYNSCRNRHCPECQALDQARWIKNRTERILPVGHYHVVFTLPSELRPLARYWPKLIYGALLRAAAHTLTRLAKDRWHARLGVTAVLHTWTRELHFHPHVHCIVTAGGFALDDDRWVDKESYLFPVNQLKHAYVKRFKKELQRLRDQGKLLLPEEGEKPTAGLWKQFLSQLPKWRRWNLHLEAPFGRSAHVLKYLGRYTHRVAISDTRVVSIGTDAVTFRTRGDDRRTLQPQEFIRRFLLHILPKGFHKIRHYGLYASGAGKHLARARELLDGGDQEPPDPNVGWAEFLKELTNIDALRCPRCSTGQLVQQRELPRKRIPPQAKQCPRGPP